MRYYLIVPKKTFTLINQATTKNGKEIENSKYDEKIATQFSNLFKRTYLTSFDKLQPKSSNKTMAIMEVDTIDQYPIDEKTLKKESTTSQYKSLLNEETKIIIPEKIIEYYLNKLVDDNLIKGFYHWPHRDDEKTPCIHCYLNKHKKDWQLNNEETQHGIQNKL